jgi:starch synthase
MRVAFIAAECEPWAKTGGLADVVDALARALGQAGRAELDGLVDVFLPRYRSVQVPDSATATVVEVPDARHPGQTLRLPVLEAETHGYRLHLVDHPPAYARDGLYGDAKGDYPDNAWRFGLLCRAALERLRLEPRPPDLIHIHDWHAVPALLLRDGLLARDPATSRAAVQLTVHNLAFHGWTPAAQVPDLGLGADALPRGADGLDLLRAGIVGSEIVNTVSPGFAAEALTPAFGMGLDGELRAKGDWFVGILNGLDTDLWNPATDRALAADYSRDDRSGKALCRAGVLETLGMDPADRRPVLAMIGRLDRQKGFDLLASAAPALLERGFRLIVQGVGTAQHLGPLRALAAAPRTRDKVALVERFDRDLARQIYAGADGFLMPSRFEPCGTGQMIALRYGTPPIVRATGGLKDTVVDLDAAPDTGTGFTFADETPEALVAACDRFLAVFGAGGPTWDALLDRGMAVDFDWRSRAVPAYLAAYRRAIELRTRPAPAGSRGSSPPGASAAANGVRRRS